MARFGALIANGGLKKAASMKKSRAKSKASTNKRTLRSVRSTGTANCRYVTANLPPGMGDEFQDASKQ